MRATSRAGFVGAVAMAATLIPGLVPAGAAEVEETATLTVTKTVVGPVPADAQFTIHVTCTGAVPSGVDGDVGPVEVPPPGVVVDKDIVFGADGGSEDFEFDRKTTCTVTETDDGGADSTTGGGSILIDEPAQFDSEIVNTFVAAATTMAEPPGAVGNLAVTQPRFAG